MTPPPHILLVGLPEDFVRPLLDRFRELGWRFEAAASGRDFLRRLDEGFELALLATEPADIDAERLLEETLRRQPHLAAIAVSSEPDYSEAARLARCGAVDYLPLDRGEALRVDWMEERIRIALEIPAGAGSAPDGERAGAPRLVGESRPIQTVRQLIRMVASRLSTVLITGPTGTGKELAAKSIHSFSPRAGQPLVTVNCGAIPENLIEAELFGHVKGAFTGAVANRVGRFEQAHRGTVFLDEISEMPVEMQAKLLRVLQEREFQRIGSSETVSVDVRVVAATNCDLKQRVQRGEFREDLYYRLNVVPVSLPTLAERIEDIPLLVEHLLERVCRREELALKRVGPEALQRLMEYNWPGNVRQLENAIEKAVALSEDRRLLCAGDFPLPAITFPNESSLASDLELPPGGLNFNAVVSGIERSLLSQALERSGGNKKRAADLLGIKRTTFAAKWRVLGAATEPN